jgi:hypothetical protein
MAHSSLLKSAVIRGEGSILIASSLRIWFRLSSHMRRKTWEDMRRGKTRRGEIYLCLSNIAAQSLQDFVPYPFVEGMAGPFVERSPSRWLVQAEKGLAEFATIEQAAALFALNSIDELGKSGEVINREGLFGRTRAVEGDTEGGEAWFGEKLWSGRRQSSINNIMEVVTVLINLTVPGMILGGEGRRLFRSGSLEELQRGAETMLPIHDDESKLEVG